jgi:hypothetical protein
MRTAEFRAFGDDHDSSENGSEGRRNLQGGNYRHCGSDDEFGEFETLVRSLRSHALAVVPVELIFQALPHRIIIRRVARASWSPRWSGSIVLDGVGWSLMVGSCRCA